MDSTKKRTFSQLLSQGKSLQEQSTMIEETKNRSSDDLLFDEEKIPRIFEKELEKISNAPEGTLLHFVQWNFTTLLSAKISNADLLENFFSFGEIADRTVKKLLTYPDNIPYSINPEYRMPFQMQFFHRLSGVPNFKSLNLASLKISEFYKVRKAVGRLISISEPYYINKVSVFECNECGNVKQIKFEYGSNEVLRSKCDATVIRQSGYKKFKHQNICMQNKWNPVGNPRMIEVIECILDLEDINEKVMIVLEGKFDRLPEPGNHYTFTGYLMPLFKSVATNLKLNKNKIAFYVLNIEKKEKIVRMNKENYGFIKPPEEGLKSMVDFRNDLLFVFDRYHYGTDELLISLFLYLIRNTTNRFKSGKRNINLLLVGDPQSGKTRSTRLLQFHYEDSTLVHGSSIQTDTLNLTLRYYKDRGQHHISAGMLIHGNYSLLMIDDYDLMGSTPKKDIEYCIQENIIVDKRTNFTVSYHVGLMITVHPKQSSSGCYEESANVSDDIVKFFDIIVRLRKTKTKSTIIVDKLIKEKCNPSQKEEDNNFLLLYLSQIKLLDPLVDQSCKEMIGRYIDRVRRKEKYYHRDPKLIYSSIECIAKTHAQMYNRNACTIFDVISAVAIVEPRYNTGLYINYDNFFVVKDFEEFVLNYEQLIDTITYC